MFLEENHNVYDFFIYYHWLIFHAFLFWLVKAHSKGMFLRNLKPSTLVSKGFSRNEPFFSQLTRSLPLKHTYVSHMPIFSCPAGLQLSPTPTAKV